MTLCSDGEFSWFCTCSFEIKMNFDKASKNKQTATLASICIWRRLTSCEISVLCAAAVRSVLNCLMSPPTDTEKGFRDYFSVTLCILLGLFHRVLHTAAEPRCSLIDIMNTIRAVCWTLTCFMFSVFEFEETQLDLVKSSTQENKPTSVSDWKNWSQTPPWVLLLEALHVWRPRSLWCFSFVHCHHTSFSFTHHFIISSLHLSSVTSLSLCVLCFVLESLQMFTDVTIIILIMKSATLFLCECQRRGCNHTNITVSVCWWVLFVVFAASPLTGSQQQQGRARKRRCSGGRLWGRLTTWQTSGSRCGRRKTRPQNVSNTRGGKKLQLKQPAHFQELCASQEIKIWPFKVIIIQANMLSI